MINNRTDLLPENDLVTRLTALRDSVNEIKATQFMGSDSIITNRVFSTNDYDLEATNIGVLSKNYIVTFIPDNNLGNNGTVLNMTYLRQYVAGGGVGIAMQRLKIEPGQSQQWLFAFSFISSSPFTVARLKLYFYTIGAGTFTVQQVI